MNWTFEEEIEKLRAIVAGISDGVLLLDSRERVVFLNPRATALLPPLTEKDLGRSLVEAIRLPDLLSLVARSIRTGEKEKKRITLYQSGGDVVLEVQALPFASQPERGVMVLLHDITEIARTEALRQDFVANASHELRTPLAVVKGYVETLLDGAGDERTIRERFLRQILENVNRLTALTDDLLSLSRIEAGRALKELEPLSAREMLREAVERYRPLVERKGLHLTYIEPPEELRFLVDRRAFAEVIDNLLENALKYTLKGEVKLSATEVGEEVRVSVADTGIGIVKSEQGRIFERFYRVDKSHSGFGKGTGLGLSIVRHLTDQMNGKVEVESESGVGSTFSVLLPKPL